MRDLFEQAAKESRHLRSALDRGLNFIAQNIGWKLTEHDLTENIAGHLGIAGFEVRRITAGFESNSRNANYHPAPADAAVIRRSGWLLLTAETAYAEVTKCAYLGGAVPSGQRAGFEAVVQLREALVKFIAAHTGPRLNGSQVWDECARIAHKLGFEYPRQTACGALVVKGVRFAFEADSEFKFSPPALLTLSPFLVIDDRGVSSAQTYLWDGGMMGCGEAQTAPDSVMTRRRVLTTKRRNG